MLKVYSGPFHPHLESAFADLFSTKKPSFESHAVVAPSGRLRDRAQMLLSERGLSLAGLHFHTIGSLADEVLWNDGGVRPDIVSDPLFFDTLVKLILKNDRPFEGVEDLAVPDGFPPSVRATLRDLVDAGVEPEKLLEAVNEREEFDIAEVDVGSLKQLIRLYRLYLDRLAEIGISSRSAVMEKAAAAAPTSSFLSGFKSILFYGFYDLTGLQATFFEEVSRHHNTGIFVPYLHRHPDHEFSSRFRGDVLHKIPHEEILLTEAVEPHYLFQGPASVSKDSVGPMPVSVRWPGTSDEEVRVANVSGLRDEAWILAGEILQRHREGVPFSQIAVVARTRERLSRFAPVLEERGIPYTISWQRTLGESPQAEIGLALMREAMDGIVDPNTARSPDIQPAATSESTLADSWPTNAGWPDHVARAVSVLDQRVKPVSDLSAAAWKSLRAEVEKLNDFRRLSASVSRTDFLETLRERWIRQSVPAGGSAVGVSLLHGEAARGLSFDVVILAGLEERVFPRVIREDPFLRDKSRHAISHTIGNKISEKMLALAEERLLLHLILASARRRLYITYQRSDDEGKIVGASSFLRRLVSEWGVEFDFAVNVIPRRLTDKLAVVAPESLGTRDLVSGFLMAGRPGDAVTLARSLGREDRSLARGVAAVDELEKWENPGPFDGLVGPAIGSEHLSKAGMSPSGLESYGRCPYQYFVSRVLRVAPLEEPASPEEIAADQRGKLIHGFLEGFYLACAEKYPKAWPGLPPESLFDEMFDTAFAVQPPEVFPLLWNALRDALKVQTFALVAADFHVLSERKLRPAYFEHRYASTTLDKLFDGVRFQGIMDRVDLGEKRARVVDYKSGARQKGRVATMVLKGEKSQPPVYLRLAAEFLAAQGVARDAIDFSYLHLGEEQPLSELDAADWKSIEAETVATIAAELKLIAAGQFPILPGRHCDWCDAATVCRKTDSISAYRTEPASAELRKLHTKKPGGKS